MFVDLPENQDQQVLVPDLQSTLTFHEKPLIAVRLANGDHGVVLRWLCENLHLDVTAQIQRIKRTEVIADDLVYVRIQTLGGPQVMPTLLLRAIPYWLATIDTRRMDRGDERRAEILEYQRNAVDALYRWAQSLRSEGRTALIEAEPIEKPATPEKDAGLHEWQYYYEQMAAFMAWRISLEEWRGTVENRLENLEAVVPLILEQLSPATITPTHQNVVKYYVSELHKLTHKPYAAIWSMIYTSFQVPRYQELREEDWSKIQSWFREQFRQAGRTPPGEEQEPLF
jgi:P22_AR N-terminal domain